VVPEVHTLLWPQSARGQEPRAMTVNRYLVLSAFSGFLEVGVLVLAVQLWPETLWLPFAVGLAYQLGTFLAVRRSVPALVVAIVSLLLLGGLLWQPQWAELVLITLVLSWGLQNQRQRAATPVTVVAKRLARTVGFAFSALWVTMHGWVVAVLSLIMVLLVGGAAATAPPRRLLRTPARWTIADTTMFLHQMHYFVYVYGMVTLLQQQAGVPLTVVGLWFAAGWVTYFSAERLFAHHDDARVLVYGHLFLTGVLSILALNVVPGLTGWLWILTGLGGGTVYCIHRLGESKDEHERSEEAGHMVGPFLGLTLIAETAKSHVPVAAAALLALLVAALVRYRWQVEGWERSTDRG